MRKLLAYITLIVCLSVSAQDNPFVGHPELKDSLEAASHNHPHDSTLLQLLDALFVIDVQQPNVHDRGHALYQEADLQNNDRYRLQAARYLSALYYNEGALDSSYVWSLHQEKLASKLKHWPYYMKALNNMADIHISNKRYEFAHKECLKMREKAIELGETDGRALADLGLLNIYKETGRSEEEEQLLNEVMEYLPHVKSFYITGNTYIHFLRIYRDRKRYDKVAEGLKVFQDFLDQSCRKKPDYASIYRDYYVSLESYYIQYFLAQNKIEEAYRHVEQGRSYITPSTYHTFLGQYESAVAHYYAQKGMYKEALDHLDSALLCYDSRTTQSAYQKECRNQAAVLAKWGRTDEAFEIYKHALAYRDNQLQETITMQREEFSRIYHIDELERDRSRLNHRMMQTLLVASILLMLLLTIYLLRVQRIRRCLKLSDQEIEQNMRIAEQADKDKEAFMTNISYLVRIPLNSVVGFAQILCTETDLDAESRKEICLSLQSDSKHLLDLVNDILELSRLEAHKTKWAMQEADLVYLCRMASTEASQRDEKRPEIHFSTEVKRCVATTDVERMADLLGSLFKYPDAYRDKEPDQPEVHITQQGNRLFFTFINPPIMQIEKATDDINIRHMVNRLLIEYFGGTYQESMAENGTKQIKFDYPLATEHT